MERQKRLQKPASTLEAIKAVEENRFKKMADCCSAVIWMSDTKGRIDFVNNEYLMYFGLKYHEAIGSDWRSLLHPDDCEVYLKAFKEVMDSHEYFHHRARVKRCTGEWRWVESRANPYFDEQGKLKGYIGSSPDITELYESKEKLKIADRRKDEFLATLAHELRNPLAPISNAVQMMQLSSFEDPRQEEAVNLIERQMKQIVRFVDDLMDVSRITQGKIVLQKQEVNLTDVLVSVIEVGKPLLKSNGHTFDVDIQCSECWVDGDITRLIQIFSNILNNAVKYTPAGGHIHISLKQAGDQAVVCIQDNGVGIRAEHLKSIFDMFFQIDKEIGKSGGGLGIGLMLVKDLVALHHGHVEVFSDGDRKGSSFIVTLPCIIKEELKKGLDVQQDMPFPLQAYRILIVDDNQASAQTLGWMMEMYGQKTHIAYNSQDAIKIAKKYKPDFVFLDIGMPDMNGYELCEAMKHMPELNDTVFIAQTGWDQKEHRVRSQAAGFHHHLVKPIEMDSIKNIFLSKRH